MRLRPSATTAMGLGRDLQVQSASGGDGEPVAVLQQAVQPTAPVADVAAGRAEEVAATPASESDDSGSDGGQVEAAQVSQ